MGINFEGLCQRFTEKIKKVYIEVEPDVNFVDVELIIDKKTEFLENYIYVGTTSTLKGIR